MSSGFTSSAGLLNLGFGMLHLGFGMLGSRLSPKSLPRGSNVFVGYDVDDLTFLLRDCHVLPKYPRGNTYFPKEFLHPSKA